MQDRIILGNGKANNIKFNLAGINSWEQFVAANAAGTLQADVTYNNDGTGTSVIGTLLNKANLLTDATAASLGVTSSDPTIEEAFKALAEFERGLIRIETFSGNRTINANSSGTFRASDLSVEWPSGYRPIAFAAINFSTSTYIRLRSYTVDATGTSGIIGVWNYGSNNIDCNCTVKMIFAKESVL